MNTVTLHHPDLGEMQVLPITVPSWRSRGWEPVAEEQSIAEPTPAEEPDEQETPRRRRAQKESE